MVSTSGFIGYDDWYARIRKSRPFLRWAGGKQPFLLQHPKIVPTFSGKYIEPFLGGGSVFFQIMRTQQRPCPAILGDINRELIGTYIGIKENPTRVSQALEAIQAGYSAATDKSEYYLSMRTLYNAQRPKVDPAVFIFVNRTCWNGLYRLNRSGAFNVPYGNPKADRVVPSEEELLNVSAALQQAEIRNTSWENSLAMAEKGDFVFLDPPYLSDVDNDNTKYAKQSFSERQHLRLAEAASMLARLGIRFVLTNSAEDRMEAAYLKLGLRVRRLSVPRYISSKTSERAPVHELVVTASEP